jgi:hypothetical protein
MKLFILQRNVMSGQCKRTLLRIQVGYTALLIFPGLIPGWCGSQIGLFTPGKTENGYRCTEFYVHPWLAPDIPVCRLPKWYLRLVSMISFETSKA